MPRKSGDFNYANYVGFQAFSSDEPTHRINNTNWYLKWEQGRPGFFINTENVFKQLSKECFKATASAKSKMEEMAGYQKQVEQKIKISISRLGQKVSEATKVKLSKANTGEKNPMWGRKQSPETIAKLRTRAKKRWTVEARKNWSGNNHHNFGKTWSDSHKKKIGNSVSGSNNGMWGKKHSNHSIMKMSLSHKGHIPWNKGSKGLIVAWNKGLKLKQINGRRIYV